jgi:hypothetical protein
MRHPIQTATLDVVSQRDSESKLAKRRIAFIILRLGITAKRPRGFTREGRKLKNLLRALFGCPGNGPLKICVHLFPELPQSLGISTKHAYVALPRKRRMRPMKFVRMWKADAKFKTL